MSQVKISIALSPEIHRAAKLEAIARGSLTAVIEDIIDSRLTGARLKRPANTVDAPSVRPSVMLDSDKLAGVTFLAGKSFSANSLISQWVREYFERQVSA